MVKKEIDKIYNFHSHLMDVYCDNYDLFYEYLKYLKTNKVIQEYEKITFNNRVHIFKMFNSVLLNIQFEEGVVSDYTGTTVFFNGKTRFTSNRPSTIFKESCLKDAKEDLKNQYYKLIKN